MNVASREKEGTSSLSKEVYCHTFSDPQGRKESGLAQAGEKMHPFFTLLQLAPSAPASPRCAFTMPLLLDAACTLQKGRLLNNDRGQDWAVGKKEPDDHRGNADHFSLMSKVCKALVVCSASIAGLQRCS